MKTLNRGFIVLCTFISFSYLTSAQEDTVKKPYLVFDELEYDFGNVGERDGYAEHIFNFKNIGTAPLVLTQVQASCGCTKPQWSTDPIEPDKNGLVVVSYDPRGRIGPFNKIITVYTNEENGFKRHRLTIKGTVVEKPRDPDATYVDTIGGLGIQNNVLDLKILQNTSNNQLSFYIKNFSDKTLYLNIDGFPESFTFKYPDSLKADWAAELTLNIDGANTKDKRGRLTDYFNLIVKDVDGKILGSKSIPTTAIYLDNFSTLSPLQKVNAGLLEIPVTSIDFGVVKSRWLGGNSLKKAVLLINKGKSDLILHTVTSDDDRVHLPVLQGKTIKTGETLSVDVTVKAKELIDSDIDTEIVIVCNDPKGPVRRIKVDAKKAN